MYYIKIFLLYSLIGFVYESTLFKIKHSSKYSGIFYGPITAVYGIGVLAIEILNKYYFNMFIHIHMNLLINIIAYIKIKKKL